MSQWLQYPENTSHVFSYTEARGVSDDASFNIGFNYERGGLVDDLVFAGMQGYIRKYLMTPFTQADIDEADEMITAHGQQFNREGWEYILEKYDGYMPLQIEALPEGTIAPLSTPLMRIINTDPKCFWCTSYVETEILRAIWYPTTVATNSNYIKRDIKRFMIETGGDLSALPFKLHDFGAPGVSSIESANIGGVGHLINFMGTDTFSSLKYARDAYDEPMAGFSIPASEHSTITSWGRDNEEAAYENMIKKFGGPGKVFACVSDSYDIYSATTDLWGGSLKDQVKNNGGTLVIQPDSGDPTSVVLNIVNRLVKAFAEDVTEVPGAPDESGKILMYKLLPRYVRVIQGDGINRKTIRSILDALKLNGLCADNVEFGMGSSLLQSIDRDNLKFAMKCSAISIKSQPWNDVYKDPIDDKCKSSKRGLLDTVTLPDGRLGVSHIGEKDATSAMVLLYKNGKMFNETTLAEIRKRASV